MLEIVMGWGKTPGTPEANRRAHVESWTKGGEVRDFNEPFNKPSAGTPAADPALSATRALPPAAMQSSPWAGASRRSSSGTDSTILTSGGGVPTDGAPGSRRKQLLGA
jgi:hypothetical protein